MTELEYLCGIVLLLFGFNLGYYEAGKGLTLEDIKSVFKLVLGKFRK